MEEIITGQAAALVDRYCIRELEIPSLVLMERAALAVADHAQQMLQKNPAGKKDAGVILVVCGTGNNGADGIAAARILEERGYRCRLVIVGEPAKGSREFLLQERIARHPAMDIRLCRTDGEALEFPFLDPGQNLFLVVDALFGIGLSRNVTGCFETVIQRINQQTAPVLSVDIPSGLHADTGQVMGICVKAAETITFGKKKAGHLLCDGKDYCGRVEVKPIGFSEKAYAYLRENQRESVYGCHTPSDLQMVPDRRKTSHKGSYGTVHIVGSGAGMSGAGVMAGISALRCGCGLVRIYAAPQNTPVIRALFKEAIVCEQEEFDSIAFSPDRDVVVAGPGLGMTTAAEAVLEKVLTADCPLVLDADALNLLAKNRQLFNRISGKKGKIIVTPHLKEMARLTGMETSQIRADLARQAVGFAKETGFITVLKDAATVIADPEGNIRINCTGNSGMSKGGSGDILAGIIGGLLSQHMESFDAASLGVYLHGRAGDLAAAKKSEYGMTASDLIEEIPSVWKERENGCNDDWRKNGN